MSGRLSLHCPRCRMNIDSWVCPRCGALTERGFLPGQRRRFANAATDSAEPTVYTLSLRRIREGGVDLEA